MSETKNTNLIDITNVSDSELDAILEGARSETKNTRSTIMTNLQYQVVMQESVQAQGRVSGILRVGWYHASTGMFFFHSHEFHAVPACYVRELKTRKKRT